MGCDIHFYVERKNGEVWESADKWIVDTDYDEPQERVDSDSEFYGGRNYNLFAILADVRNGRGFAGIITGEGFNPICPPKGIPDDASHKVKMSAERWDGDGHSHSWHTLADLLAFDWTQTSGLSGYVSASEYWAWNHYNRGRGLGPESYCGDVGGGAVQKITNSAMDELIKEITKGEQNYHATKSALEEKARSVYTRVNWVLPYYRCAGSFWSETIPRLLRLGRPEDVRIVFWFDN